MAEDPPARELESCHHRMARRPSGRARDQRGRRLVLSAGAQARRQGRISRRPHSRARCSSTSTPSPTIPPTCRTCCPAPTSSPRRSARSASARMTPSWSTTAPAFARAARVVDIPVFGAKNVYILDGGLPKWKAEGRAARDRPAHAHAAKVQGRTQHAARSPRRRRADGADSTSPPRWSMRGRPTASAARRRSRAPGLRGGHMPGAFNVPFDRAARRRPADRAEKIAPAFAGRRRRSRQADDHQLRLRRHRRDALRSRSTRSASRRGALRRLLVRMGRPAGPAGGEVAGGEEPAVVCISPMC